MKFRRHENGLPDWWQAYTDDGSDPAGENTVVHGYVGPVFPCAGENYPDPECAAGTGTPCGRFHGQTGTHRLPRHPLHETHGHETKEAAAEGLLAKRREWAREITEGEK